MPPRHTLVLVRSSNPAWEGLRQALTRIPDLDIVGDAATVDEARNVIGRLQPDLVATAATVRGASSIANLVAELRLRSPASRFVVIVDRVDQVGPQELLVVQGLGVEGQLLWSELSADRFYRCLLLIAEDGCVVASRQVAEAFLDALRYRPIVLAVAISPRERQVLPLIAAGETDDEIAAQLHVRACTVQTHVSRLAHKLEARNRPHLIALAIRQGLLTPAY